MRVGENSDREMVFLMVQIYSFIAIWVRIYAQNAKIALEGYLSSLSKCKLKI